MVHIEKLRNQWMNVHQERERECDTQTERKCLKRPLKINAVHFHTQNMCCHKFKWQ